MKCKRCGNTSFSYVEGPKKGAPWYISLLLILATIISMSIDAQDRVINWSAIIFAFTFFFLIANKITKKRTATKAICNNCQKIKYIK